MRTYLLSGLLLIPVLAIADGSMVIRPKPNGTLQVTAEGGSGVEAARLTQLQPAGESVTLYISPSGPARCENGNIVVSPLTIQLQLQPDETRLICGQPVRFEAPLQERRLHVQTMASLTGSTAALLQQALPTRTQIGRVSFTIDNHSPTLFPLFLDLSDLQQQAPTVSAAFDKPTLLFGLVGEHQNASSNASLRITKTAMASNEALGYMLSFESNQQRNNQWQLRTQSDGNLVPYSLRIDGKMMAPGNQHYGILPQGRITSDLIILEFSLCGKHTRGLPAGTRLLDTLTAVISPES